MKKFLKNLWANKVTVFCFICGLIMGNLGVKYFALVYENELMTNLLLKQEINDYIKGEDACSEN